MNDDWHMLAEEERLFCDVLGRICAEQIAPRAAETDESGRFVHDQLAILGQAGMMGANLPEAYGGSGISAPALLSAVAIVAGACGSTASALTAHYLATDSILIGGTEAQRQHWLPPAAEGAALGAFALTEPTAGSDPADMQTRARRTAEGWHLKGTKCFISNGGVADFIVVYAVTDPALGHRGISAFILPRGTPGLQAGSAERTMGLRGGHVFTLNIDCHLPPEALLGEEGRGFRTAMQVLDNGRIEVAAQCLGMAQAAMTAAIDYARQRVIGGMPLTDRQGIRWMIADMGVAYRAALLLAQDAARQRQAAHDGGGGRFSLAASMAKLAASEAAGRIADTALQLHGGYGYTRDFPVERICRDLRIMRIYEGSSEIQRTIISGNMLA
ncbi:MULTISPECIES: acyl-CoA dehydrogenase family protein [unclassified Paracoccus (in: a-proteobacteria)]|uniref:acyl-CoA dehydrogenase family protein n=1 Tax=unclassified Paracoccus (in: a-proteobacteria) TaxID=2688777 RepID=UPI0012B375A2|nr:MULTISPECIES: acyl-CoA dehydrogenase family protein [unclassified Paracoccus (in: a-proteobacteria)]UXU75378.1 acyl-CoA dehydrogenase family protein [Paracoccus sp. SMMA_5]UXU81282.1 acyl-CoA dehydrogenase family protein [Paracoccus sp. SMMA_5_TC]